MTYTCVCTTLGAGTKVWVCFADISADRRYSSDCWLFEWKGGRRCQHFCREPGYERKEGRQAKGETALSNGKSFDTGKQTHQYYKLQMSVFVSTVGLACTVLCAFKARAWLPREGASCCVLRPGICDGTFWVGAKGRNSEKCTLAVIWDLHLTYAGRRHMSLNSLWFQEENTWKTETGEFGHQVYPQQHSESEVSLGYMKLQFKGRGGDESHMGHT